MKTTAFPLGLLVAVQVVCLAQAPPPGPPGPPRPLSPANHLNDVREKIAEQKTVNATSAKAKRFAQIFLSDAETALKAKHVFRADRLGDAADAMAHVAEHETAIATGRPEPPGPIAPPPPPPDGLEDHFQRVYFRTKQADYFWRLSQDKRAISFPRWARDFYQLAIQAKERKNDFAAEENLKSADDVVRCLENLAQAASSNPAPIGR